MGLFSITFQPLEIKNLLLHSGSRAVLVLQDQATNCQREAHSVACISGAHSILDHSEGGFVSENAKDIWVLDYGVFFDDMLDKG